MQIFKRIVISTAIGLGIYFTSCIETHAMTSHGYFKTAKDNTISRKTNFGEDQLSLHKIETDLIGGAPIDGGWPFSNIADLYHIDFPWRQGRIENDVCSHMTDYAYRLSQRNSKGMYRNLTKSQKREIDSYINCGNILVFF